MDRLAAILPAVLQHRDLAHHAAAAHALFLARRWIDEEMPSHALALQPRSFRDGCLVLVSSNSIALCEANARLSDLQRFLSRAMPTLIIVSIRVVRL